MSQTTYNPAPDAAVAGMIGDSTDYTTRTGNNPAAALEFGLAVAKVAGNSDEVTTTAGVTAGAIVGVAVREVSTTNNNYPVKSAVTYMTQGAIWVETDETVAVGDDVYVRVAGGNIGKFRNDADTANAVLLPNSRWLTGVTGAGLALLSLNLA